MNFYDEQENIDSKLLEEFNDEVHYFKGLTANTRMSKTDFKATDKKDRLIHIELKQRKGTIEQYQRYGDVLIEPSKVAAFTAIMESGFTNNEKVLYVNFVDDGLIMFDVDKIPFYKNYPNHKQMNYGRGKVEHETRFGIPMSCAIIFRRNSLGKYERVRTF